MLDDTSEVIDLVLGSGRFRHIFVENGYVFIANEINQLTGLCAPSVRGVMGHSRIDYDRLLVVVGDLAEPLDSLKKSVAARRYLGLPKIVKPSHSLDVLVHHGRLSEWLVAEMVSDLAKYTLDRQRALHLIQDGNDKFIRDLKMVYGDRFQKTIEEPLAKLT